MHDRSEQAISINLGYTIKLYLLIWARVSINLGYTIRGYLLIWPYTIFWGARAQRGPDHPLPGHSPHHPILPNWIINYPLNHSAFY